MAVYEGSVVFVRARATKKVTYYENGTAQDNEGEIVVQPITPSGEPSGDFIRVNSGSVISAEAIKAKVKQQVENER